MAHLVKKNTTMSVTIAIPRAFSLSLQHKHSNLSVPNHSIPFHTKSTTDSHSNGH